MDYKSLIGWVGMALVLIGYIGIVFKKWDSNDDSYHWVNLLGAAGLIYISYETKSWPVVGLNVVWALVALYGLVTKKK